MGKDNSRTGLGLASWQIRVKTSCDTRLSLLLLSFPMLSSVVEAVRRQYKQRCQDADRADKQAIRDTGGG